MDTEHAHRDRTRGNHRLPILRSDPTPQSLPPPTSADTQPQHMQTPNYRTPVKQEPREEGVDKDDDQDRIFKSLIPPIPPSPMQGAMRRDSKNSTPLMGSRPGQPQFIHDYSRAPEYYDEHWEPQHSAHSPPLSYLLPIPNQTIAPRPLVQKKGALWDVADQYLLNEPVSRPEVRAQIRAKYMPADYYHELLPPPQNTLKDLTSLAVQFDIEELPEERRHANGVNWIVQSPEAGYALMRQLKAQRLQANPPPPGGAMSGGGHMPPARSGSSGGGGMGMNSPVRRSPHAPVYGSAPASGNMQIDMSYPPGLGPGPNPTSTSFPTGNGTNNGNIGQPRTSESDVPHGWNPNPSGDESMSIAGSGPQASPTRVLYSTTASAPPGWQHPHPHSQPSSAHPDRVQPSPGSYWPSGQPPHTISSPTRPTWSSAEDGRPPSQPQSHPMTGRPWPAQPSPWGPPPHHSGSEHPHSMAHVPNSSWSNAPHGLANPPSGTIPLENIDGRADGFRLTSNSSTTNTTTAGVPPSSTPITAQPVNHPWDGADPGSSTVDGTRRSRAGTGAGNGMVMRPGSGPGRVGSGNASPVTWSPHAPNSTVSGGGGATHAPWMNTTATTGMESLNPNVPLGGRIQTPGGTGAAPQSHSGSIAQQQQQQQQQQAQSGMNMSIQSGNPSMGPGNPTMQSDNPNIQHGIQLGNPGHFGGPSSGYGLYPGSTAGPGGAVGREIPFGSQPDSVASYNNGERGPGPGGAPSSSTGGPAQAAYPHHHPHHHGGNPYPPMPMTSTTGSAPYGISRPVQTPVSANPNQPGQQLHQQPPPNAQANVYPNVYAMHPSQPPSSQQGGMSIGESFGMYGPSGGGPQAPITYPLNPNPMVRRVSMNPGGPNPGAYGAWPGNYGGRPFEGDGRV